MEYVPPFERGSKRTLLDHKEANRLVGVANAVRLMQGFHGVTVTVSDANILIGLDPVTLAQIEDPGGGGTEPANVAFRGEWSGGTTYIENDIVIRSTPTDKAQSKAGTFISLADGNVNHEPPTGEVMADAYWTCLARGHWRFLQAADPATPSVGKFTTTGGRARFDVDGNSPPTRVTFDPADGTMPQELVGKTFTFRLIKVCVDGVEMSMGVLGTEPF
jgi:hypothetical protein